MALIVLVVLILHQTCSAKDTNRDCVPSSCGNIPNISSPFRLENHPPNCGNPGYTLSCQDNKLVLYLLSVEYYVLEINYTSKTIRVVDSGIQKDDYSYIPSDYSSSSYNTRYYRDSDGSPTMTIKAGDVEDLCQVEQIFGTSWRGPVNLPNDPSSISCADLHNLLLYGFELHWYTSTDCGKCGIFEFSEQRYCCERHTAKFMLGVPFVLAFLIYKWRRRHLSAFDIIEEFLQNNNNLIPIRYSYSEIRNMTKKFKDKLGEGGYGTVFKGTLRSGRLVAIKMLGKSKANGQEFISEVATIGRIHHINIVQLIGFCVEGSKRALIYEFMPNGSLNKYIFSQEGSLLLSYEKMHNIALGVARGIEYLHQGCNMQILHFDIKPHNILLDEDFTPKVSDFGLAKLYPMDNNTISLTAVRGTLGYMAPELCYKNIGSISYKADVYSFGMLLMDMMGKRRNLNVFGDQSSKYFPSCVYEEVQDENGITIENGTEEEKKIAKLMIIVALWCIQMKPNDRPSMNKVVEMLEGSIENLQIPPKPFLSSLEGEPEDIEDNSNLTFPSIQSSQYTQSSIQSN
ncbi:hypothetical protein I3842_05G245700 [Carya illinoinensis]|uniref:Protein kinase domain-containing protein n=1 Tax=Carya illinoinensis TaxID=32201 RepID=A0A922F6V8_CARIL|nr:hypothetical protein I3842_05G245700 [Carya illinoinensis]